MSIKFVVMTIVPWCGFIGLGSYQVYEVARERLQRARFMAKLPDDFGTEDLRMLHNGYPFKVYMFRQFVDKWEECVAVEAYDKHLVMIRRNTNVPGTLNVSLYRSMDPLRPILDCGSFRDGPFPGFLSFYPQTGPDAGRWFGDYDLDGQFEIKAPNIFARSTSAPADGSK